METTFALAAQHLDFLRLRGLSMIAASHGPGNIPCLARALGCRLSPDQRQVTLFFSADEGRELVDQVAATGAIAAVFSLPRTHQALQLKGSDGRAVTPGPADAALVNAYCDGFVAHLDELGYPGEIIRSLLFCESDHLAAIAFTPTAAFSQTPGPHAGKVSE